MNILVACEESQAVVTELRAKGHNAFSCDIQQCSGGHNEWHIQTDVVPLLNGDCEFQTLDGQKHSIIGQWDMIIAFPPCTNLAISGASHFKKKREDGSQLEAIKLFSDILNAKCDKICVENPLNIIGGKYIEEWFPQYSNLPKWTQRIQPYEYGHAEKKSTCLWLKGLPNLVPTNIVEPQADFVYASGKHYPNWMIQTLTDHRTNEERRKARSKTFIGIAEAMAKQWT